MTDSERLTIWTCINRVLEPFRLSFGFGQRKALAGSCEGMTAS